MRLIDADKVPYVVINGFEYAQKEDIDQMDDIDPVKHGYWRTFTPLAQPRYVCSECFATGKYHVWSDVDGLNYCPHCGAKMDEGATYGT